MKHLKAVNGAVIGFAFVIAEGAIDQADAANRRSPPPNTAAPATAAPAPGMPGGPPMAAATAAERAFVTSAISSGMLEVEASRLALERSKQPQLRSFAQRMVDEHAKANEELRALAHDAGLTDVPTTTMGKYNAMLEKLRALKDQDFEQEYVAQIGVASHVEAVALFDEASKELANPELKAFAAKLLPQLREHLKQSRAVAKAVGVPADRPSGSTAGRSGTTGSGASAEPGRSSSGTATGSSGQGTVGGTGVPMKSSTGK